jgi:nucleoside-diphosphate-sugar epimerase
MIKWISDYLGTAAHDRIADQDNLRIVDVRDLVDKPGNFPATAREKINEAVAYLKRGEKIVICCDYGISRSNAIAAGILSLSEEIPFNDAIRRVIEATGEEEIKIEVLSAVRDALEDSGETPRAQANHQRIFVTGGSGFIGKALVSQLRGKHEVYASARDEIDLNSGPVNLDLFAREHDIDCIVHLANPRIYNTNRAMGESLVLMKNVLDVCRQNQIKLIYLSNWEVYSGYSASFLLASESLPPLPKGISGETKYLCEQLLEQHRRNYGLQSILLRSGSVYGGEGDRPKFIFNFLSKAASDEKIVAHKYLNGFPSLDLLHINDLTWALSELIDSDYTGTLHVGSGLSISTTQVANLIVDITGSRSQVEHCEIQDYAPNIVMDCSRAKSVLGWQPRITFEEGLRMLLAERMPQQTVTKENG